MQKGFATLEVILMVMVIGILASIAVPRFTSVTTAANTAKIQSDLSTIDAAIQVYYMEHGEYPKTFPTDLSNYIQGVENLKQPSGSAYIKTGNGEPTETTISGNYGFSTVNSDTGEVRAALGTYTADKFYIPKKGTSPTTGD